jgi:hypothetical protein
MIDFLGDEEKKTLFVMILGIIHDEIIVRLIKGGEA